MEGEQGEPSQPPICPRSTAQLHTFILYYDFHSTLWWHRSNLIKQINKAINLDAMHSPAQALIALRAAGWAGAACPQLSPPVPNCSSPLGIPVVPAVLLSGLQVMEGRFKHSLSAPITPFWAGSTLCSRSACSMHEAVLPCCYCIPRWGRKWTLQLRTGGVQQSKAQHSTG